MSSRACGACTVCCYIPGVPELGKEPYVPCPHASCKGCAIYERRPSECRAYRCLWLDDAVGDEEDRPDRLGLMFDLPSLVQDHPDYQGIAVICAREVHLRARDGERASALITRLARGMVVRLTDPAGKTQLLGPRTSIELLLQRAAARAAAGG